MKMKAIIQVMELTVRLERFWANCLAQLADLKLGATSMIMTEMMSKENEKNLMKLLWSCHVGGFRGVPVSVRHGGVRVSRSFCFGKLSLGIGFGGVSLGTCRSTGKDWDTAPSSSSAAFLIRASCRSRWLHPSSGRPFLRLSFFSF